MRSPRNSHRAPTYNLTPCILARRGVMRLAVSLPSPLPRLFKLQGTQRFPTSGTKSLPTRHSDVRGCSRRNPEGRRRRRASERARERERGREKEPTQRREPREKRAFFSVSSPGARRRFLTRRVKSGNRRRESICSFARYED